MLDEGRRSVFQLGLVEADVRAHPCTTGIIASWGFDFGAMPLHLVASPAYLKEHGRPKHPMELAKLNALTYSYQLTADTWQFRKPSGETAAVRPAGSLRVNNGEAMLPSIVAGIGVGILPDFIVKDAIAAGHLETLLPEWSLPEGAVYWVTPQSGPRPRRVELLAEYFRARLDNRS